jgi:hypothetical protein
LSNKEETNITTEDTWKFIKNDFVFGIDKEREDGTMFKYHPTVEELAKKYKIKIKDLQEKINLNNWLQEKTYVIKKTEQIETLKKDDNLLYFVDEVNISLIDSSTDLIKLLLNKIRGSILNDDSRGADNWSKCLARQYDIITKAMNESIFIKDKLNIQDEIIDTNTQIDEKTLAKFLKTELEKQGIPLSKIIDANISDYKIDEDEKGNNE